MAKVSFRQGIVQAFQGSDTFIQTNGNYVQLNAQTANPVQIAIVDGPKDYLFTEFTTRPTAWGPFTDNKDRWLYWDINRITGVRTFGHTVKEPVVQATAPPSPTTGQMWFDTNNNVWKEYTGSSWRVVLRVFAAKFSQSSTFQSVSARAGSGQFTGTQVGITTPTRAGSIVFDTLGNPIIDQNGRFFTTEDDFITGIPTGTKLRISNIVKTAQAREPLAPFQVVQLDGVDQVKPATVSEQGRKVLGIVDTGVGTGDQIDFTTEGIVFNEQWDWFGQGLTANDPVYINNTGVITKTPQSTEQVPIGVVLDAQTIIFAPRLFPQIETQGDVPLEDLTQSGATDNQAIVWNDSVGQWEPSIRDLDSLDDVNIGTVTDQHVLTYDSSSGVWVNQTISGAGIAPKDHTHDATDVVTGQFADARISQSSVIQHGDALTIDLAQLTQSGATDGETIVWDDSSGEWIAADIAINSLNDIDDVNVPSPTDGYALTWDGTNNEWVAGDVPLHLKTISDLYTPSLTTTISVILLGFRTVGDGGGGTLYWSDSEDKNNHNGGTIIDPDHSVIPGNSGWWSAENTGTGCWVRTLDFYVTPEMFGAVGDGITDDYMSLSTAIESAYLLGKELIAIGDDYYITGQLPLYDAMTIRGSGMPFQNLYWVSVTDVSVSGSETTFTLDDPNGRLTHRIMEGDPVKTRNFDDTSNNGLFAVAFVDPSNSKITVKSSGTSTSSPGSNAEIRLQPKEKGTKIRFQRVSDGAIHTGDRFFDERGLRNLKIEDIGFIGPGINSIFGGGIRFRRTPDNRAITGYNFKNVHLEHAAMEGIRFDQLIHSVLEHLSIERCVGDGLLFQGEGNIGGTTTSVDISAPYISNCKRGIASYISAYITLTNPVVEGCAIGYFLQRAIGPTINSMASETIKFDDAGQANGVTGLFVDCYGVSNNAPTVYYNTQESAWNMAALKFVDPNRRVESPVGTVDGGHIHWSVGEKIPIVGTRWDATTDEGRIYVDVSKDWGYIPPDDAGNSSNWIGNSYWDDSVQIKIGDVQRDAIFNERYKVTNIEKAPYYTGSDYEASRDPGPNDDSDAGFAAFDPAGSGLWKNTSKPGEQGRFFCIDATPGAARWVDANALYLIEFEGRDSNPLSKEAEPKASKAYAIRAGRNYGVDIATDNIQRVVATSTGDIGQFHAELDILHCFPERYKVESNYNPYTSSSKYGYTVNDHQIVTYNSTDYLLLDCIIGNLNGHTQDDSIKDATNADGEDVFVRFEELGMPYELWPDYVKEDASSEHLYFYFPIGQFFSTGDSLDIYNTRLSEMEGIWTVDSASFVTSIVGTPAVEVICTDRTLSYTIGKTRDDAVYVSGRWSWPVTTQLNVNGMDSLFTYDAAEAVAHGEARKGTLEFPSSTAQVTMDLPAANNFEYEIYFPSSFTQGRYVSNTFNSVTFERDDTTNTETARWIAYRKKSPGFEAIHDRNRDFDENVPP